MNTEIESKVGVVIAMPIYNESEGIHGTLFGLHESFRESRFAISFIIQNDASTDETIAALESCADKYQLSIAIETNTTNMGHGPTTFRAYERAVEAKSIVLQLDSDGQFIADELIELCQAIDDGYDVAIGHRILRQDPWFRKLVTAVLRLILTIRHRKRFIDPNSPIRAYSHESLSELLKKVPQNAIIPNVYLSILHARLSLNMFEKKVTHIPRNGSQATGTMWQSSFKIIQITKLVKFCIRAYVQMREFRVSLRST